MFFITLLQRLDMYGGQVKLTFKGHTQYTTVFGGVCTIISFALLMVFYTIKSIDFIGQYDVRMSMIENVQDGTESIDLTELGYRMAVSKIDPKYGRIEIHMKSRKSDNPLEFNDEMIDLI